MTSGTLEIYIQEMLPKIETELQRAVSKVKGENLDELHAMLAYHMGWEGEGAGPEARGKRIRPLFLLLCTASTGKEWEKALPAGAAVELIHNFSLIHDDIQDNSPTRRGRPAVWTRWGIAQAINAGDAMFTLSFLTLQDLADSTSLQVTLEATRILSETCLQLTQGQYLDISYEKQGSLTTENYWPMVSGKTAALLAACSELGALAGQVDAPTRQQYRQFGYSLGLAFQAQDDLLGIWGDASRTGKSTESDLLSGKKSLPVLFGLNQNGRFAQRWTGGPIQPDEVADLAKHLEDEGAKDYTQLIASQLTDQALQTLQEARPLGEAGKALYDLALMMLQRQG